MINIKIVKENNKKKKPNVILYTIFMIIIFWGITNLGIWGYGSNTLIDAITEYPKGSLVLNEAVLASLVLILMLLIFNKILPINNPNRLVQVINLIVSGIVCGGVYLLINFKHLKVLLPKKILNKIPFINR